MKKVVSLLLVFAIVFSLLSGTLITSEAYTAHSQYEAVSWVNSQVGKALDYDGVYGAQCVDLTKYYYAYLGVPVPSGNANQYVNGGKYCPSGWSYQSSPQPGDIAVWTGGDYGHVAIVTEIRGLQMVCVEQNYAGKQYCTANLHSINAQKYIRPDFNNDKTPPSHNDFKVCEFTDGRFTVYAHVTDPSGIRYVRYAVWSDKNGQDDLLWYTGNHTDGNGYYWIHVYFSEHKNDKGNYIVHMYACDNAGNEKSVGTSYVFPEKGPTISNVKVTDVSARGYTVKCTVKSTSEMGVARVQFPTWTTKNGQDDCAVDWWNNSKVKGTISGNTVTFRVNASEHNYETGYYMTHIYAYDKIGNATSVAIPLTNVHDHKWDAGTVTRKATLTATGIKTYTCTVCGDKKTQSIACPKTFTLAKTSYVYTGKTVTPALTVKDTNGKALKKGTDYTVSYASGRKNVGKYAVKVTFKGNYSGTKTLYFTILPKGTAISKLAPAKKAFTVRWNKQAVQTTGYQIQYATNDKFSGAKVKAVKGATKINLSVTNLNGGTKYFVRIRTYKTIVGKNYYSAWSPAKAVKTK